VDDTPAKADAFFPELNLEEWTEVLREEHPADEKHAQAYTFIDLQRKA
jgi:dihydrofolate reductase